MNAPTPPVRSPLLPGRLLLNVLVMGVLLRLMLLGYWSLWLDEGATWSWTVAPTWKGTLFAEANHPPLWWLVTRAWTTLFGDSEAALRMPAAILGVVATGLTWILALRVLDPTWAPRRGGFPRDDDGGTGRRIAVWLTALIAISAYFIEYAQEARMYCALLVETLLLCLLYLRWLDKNDRLSLFLYTVVGALALYTHYFAIWPLIAHGAHALWLARRTRGQPDVVRPLPFLVAVATSGLLFVPWFVYLVTHFESFAHIAPEPFSYVLYSIWRMGAGPGLLSPDRLRQIEGPLVTLRTTWPMAVGIAVLWFVPFVLGVIAVFRRKGLRSFVAANLLLPIVLLLAMYAKFPLIHERYLLFLAPWVFLLVVLGAYATPKFLRGLLLFGVVALLAAGTIAYHGASRVLVPVRVLGPGDEQEIRGEAWPQRFVPDPQAPLYFLHGAHPYAREPWRQAHAFVRRHAVSGDLVALHPGYVHLAWDYYATHGKDEAGRSLDPLETLHLPRELLDEDLLIARYGDQLKDRQRVFLVLAHEETKDPDDYFEALHEALKVVWDVPEGRSVSATKVPILFAASWGVRVAVFFRP